MKCLKKIENTVAQIAKGLALEEESYQKILKSALKSKNELK